MSGGAPKKCLLFSQNPIPSSGLWISVKRVFFIICFKMQEHAQMSVTALTSVYPLRLIEQEKIREIERQGWHKGRYTPVYLLGFIKEGKWEV